MGRPSTYTPELGDLICERLAAGETLVSICDSDPAMPGRTTVYAWMDTHKDFGTRCARAREAQAEFMDHRILGVAGRVESGELAPDAARVVLSALQWRAAKLAPKTYGERIEHQHQGKLEHYVVQVPTTAATVDEWLTSTLSSGGPAPAPRSTS